MKTVQEGPLPKSTELGPALAGVGGHLGPLRGVVVVEDRFRVGSQHPQARDPAEGAGLLLLALVPGELAPVLQEQPLVPGLGVPGVGGPVEPAGNLAGHDLRHDQFLGQLVQERDLADLPEQDEG